jgi:hypothetical protein
MIMPQWYARTATPTCTTTPTCIRHRRETNQTEE